LTPMWQRINGKEELSVSARDRLTAGITTQE
jgi:hypothetical protein